MGEVHNGSLLGVGVPVGLSRSRESLIAPFQDDCQEKLIEFKQFDQYIALYA
jgi:hypothetical protein